MGKKEEEKEKKKKRIPRGRRNREPRDRLVKEKELNDEEDQVTNRRTRGPLGPPESLFLLFDYSAHAKIDTLWSLGGGCSARAKCQNTALRTNAHAPFCLVQ
jgi:hypothetical protein